VLGTTRFDVARASMTAVVLFLLAGIFWLGAMYVTPVRTDAEDRVALELVELPGGVEDGAVDETLHVESPDEEAPDASLTEELVDEVQVEETLNTILDVAEEAAEIAPQQVDTAVVSTGRVGSARGTGRRALGSGDGEKGLPREQRWFVRFADGGTLSEYAAQLDFFGIELGLLTPDGRLVYLWDVSSERPQTRTVDTGRDEKRLYMTWQGGNRKAADPELFRKASIDANRGTIFHFYPPAAEARLAQLEQAYRNRKPSQVRRTYFFVQAAGQGFEFAVSRQTTF
jgi:hypothetical protein